MTQFLLNIYQPDGVVPPAETLGPIMENMARLNDEIRASGAWVYTLGLLPAETAVVVRDEDDETLISDGPFTESKEHLGGFTVIEAADRDAALNWAARLAKVVSPLAVEVRPAVS